MFSNTGRPYLIHFHSILVNSKLSLRIGISSRPLRYFSQGEISPSVPIRDFRLLVRNKFTAKIKIFVADETIFEKILDTDQFGHLNYRFTITDFKNTNNYTIKVYEVSTCFGIDLFLGENTPTLIDHNSPIIISDFDKTLVDTKYKTTAEIYSSLTSPLDAFPTVNKTIDLITPFIEKNYPLFIVSASPHFYEGPIRHWLRKNEIFDSGIFLKDYRHFFSFQNTELFSKDIKVHGTFKLSQLLNLAYMLNLPKKIILFGDNSETDPLIYCLFNHLITADFDINSIWEKIKILDAFKLTQFQDFKLLNRLHLIRSLKKKNQQYKTEIIIHIRKLNKNEELAFPKWLDSYREKINFY